MAAYATRPIDRFDRIDHQPARLSPTIEGKYEVSCCGFETAASDFLIFRLIAKLTKSDHQKPLTAKSKKVAMRRML